MNETFEIVPDQSWAKKNSIEAAHAVKLPGMLCPVCGAWATAGVSFPRIDARLISDGERIDWPKPISPEEFSTLASSLEARLGIARKLTPGAELGSLSGKGKGIFGDFGWVNSWTPLLRESVFSTAQDAGVRLAGVPANLELPDGTESFVELEALPIAKMRTHDTPEMCPICGRRAIKRNDPLIINATEFDSSIPLQRLVDLPTVLVVNSAFANFIRDRKLRDVKLLAIEMNSTRQP
jgi:uncharacterized double-CXXCG motif protein